jgi:PKD repeat protein
MQYQVTIDDLNKHYDHFWDNPLVPSGYYTYDQIIAIADSLALNFPSICKKVSWGTSMGGRQLAALKISDNVDTDEPEPEIMFDGGIHGDEIGGSQNIIMFARDLCLGYGSNPTITNLVDEKEIWLYLMVNPDGRVSMSRYNNNGVDCNRDNGYMWNAEGNSYGAFSQVETRALRNCILDNQFVVYTNYHSGTEIVAYPWSYRSNAPKDLVQIDQLASVYSNTSGYSNLLYGQGYNVMYPINGSTKDFQYGSLGNIGWSIEISIDKQPVSSQIPYFYNANKPAMLEIIHECGWGVSGMITDSLTGEPVKASIWVNDYFPVYSDPVVGDYHKFLVPSTYTLKVVANGYKTKKVFNVVVPSQGTVVTDIQLVPEPNHYAYKVTGCQIPGNNFSDAGYTPGALGAPDSIPYSLGKNGWIVLDMGDTIFNGTGADFKIIQAGEINKAYTVSAGNNVDGPFTMIGTGNGTASFDLGSASMTKARYLHIKDNGAGPASGNGAGFNLDAVRMLTIPVSADFTASNTIPCSGTSVDFTDMSTGNPGSWSWSFPGAVPSSSVQQNPSNIHYSIPGTYDVSLTVSNGISSSGKTRTGFISVMQLPVVNLGSDTAICSWSSVTLNAGNPGSNYVWSTGATTQTILVDSAGTGYGTNDYTVSVTNSSGCTQNDTISVTFENCTGVHDPGNQDVRVFPNPTDGRLILNIDNFKGGRWQLLTFTGMVIDQADISQDNYKRMADLTMLPQGIFLLKIEKGSNILIKKIILTPAARK